MKKGIIFSDLDGTLIYHDDIHSLKKIRKKTEDIFLVKDLKTNKNYECYDVSTNLYGVFFCVETRKILLELKKNYNIVIVSGARKKSIVDRKKVLDFADAFLIENGGLILDKNFKEDKKWTTSFEKERKVLSKLISDLENNGWNIDNKGRVAAIRIREKDNPSKTKKEFRKLEKMKLPKELRKTYNLGSLDIIFDKAGKKNAIKYYLKKIKWNNDLTVGIGDDINDIEMLEETKKKFVLGNAYPKLKKYAKKKKWYISRGKNFEGIKEILIKIKNN